MERSASCAARICADKARRASTVDSLQAVQELVIDCRLCPRLVAHRETVARDKRAMYADWEYWGRPVPGFGDPAARLLVLGLAPAAHGGNRTGRIFTGDRPGAWMVGRPPRTRLAHTHPGV